MPYRFLRLTPPVGTAEIGDIRWAKALGHELGHYVFWLGDEYMDWHNKAYFWNYGISGPSVDEHAPHSVMHHEWKWSELSTPKDYEKFHEYLTKKYGDWKDHTTDQWGNITKNPKTDYSIWHCSTWEALYSFLSGHNDPQWIRDVFNPKSHPRHQRVLISIPSLGDNFTPKTGPYTGVGYFMEVIWG